MHRLTIIEKLKKSYFVQEFSKEARKESGCPEIFFYSAQKVEHWDAHGTYGDLQEEWIDDSGWITIKTIPERMPPDQYVDLQLSSKEAKWLANYPGKAFIILIQGDEFLVYAGAVAALVGRHRSGKVNLIECKTIFKFEEKIGSNETREWWGFGSALSNAIPQEGAKND